MAPLRHPEISYLHGFIAFHDERNALLIIALTMYSLSLLLAPFFVADPRLNLRVALKRRLPSFPSKGVTLIKIRQRDFLPAICVSDLRPGTEAGGMVAEDN